MSRREAKASESDAGKKKKRKKAAEAREAAADAPSEEQVASEERASSEEPAPTEDSSAPAMEAATEEQPAEPSSSELDLPSETTPDGTVAEEEGGEELAAESAPQVAIAELPREEQKKLIESLIFVSDRPIGPQQLGRMLKIKSAHAAELAAELIGDYQGRGVEVVELSGGYQFRSAPASAHVVRAHIAQPPVRLTRAQLETLALVAYRQPITRPEIDDVRGVDSGSALRVLLERGLLKMLGRKDEPGRPLLYGTTPFFLDFFGMRSLKDLPTLREFTELSDENRALFKRKTGESIEDAEAALLAAADAAQEEVAVAEEGGAAEGEGGAEQADAMEGDAESVASDDTQDEEERGAPDGETALETEIDRIEAASIEDDEPQGDRAEPETAQ